MDSIVKDYLKASIIEVPDYPKPGINFKDITPLLANPSATKIVIQEFSHHWKGRIEAVVALEARGFPFGSDLAYELHLPLILVRKKGKLPGKCIEVNYGLEYGSDIVEMHQGRIRPGTQVLIIDDLLATGGTAEAATKLVEMQGGVVAGCAFVIELTGLEGRKRLSDYNVHSLLKYD